MKTQHGFSIIELLVGMAVFLLFVVSAGTILLAATHSSNRSLHQEQAIWFAQEGIEAIRHLARADWDVLSVGSYAVEVSQGSWQLGSPPTLQGMFSRTITITTVNRDQNDVIVTTGGSVDESTFKVTSTVTWNERSVRPQSYSLETYITNHDTIAVSDSCSQECQTLGYEGGICTISPFICRLFGGDDEESGDEYCSDFFLSDTCCCSGEASSPTPTPSITPAPSSSPTPSTTPAPQSCYDICFDEGYRTSRCVLSSFVCEFIYGGDSEPDGNDSCMIVRDTCCCIN
jgi:prepilin-type N-terminal cleavage/methylation domain-containing protein